jgi:hypothetical protein
MTICATRSALALILALMLAACGQPSSPAVPTATDAPATPAVSSAPTTAPAIPSEPPATMGVLPAPLLFISDENDIARLELDGTTSVTVVNEQELIIDFAVAPADAALAYLTIADGTGTTIVRTSADGSGRAELAHGVIRGVSIAADGSVQAGVLFDTTDSGLRPMARWSPCCRSQSRPATTAGCGHPTAAG